MPESMPLYDLRIVPAPPRLHWGVVLALEIVTLFSFQVVWLVVQAWWVKRLTRKNAGFACAVIHLSAYFAVLAFLLVVGAASTLPTYAESAKALSASIKPFYKIVIFMLNMATVFTLRSQMESYPIRMSLSGVMTFFFGTIYFQYHMNNYALPAATDVFGDIAAAPMYVPPILPEAEQP